MTDIESISLRIVITESDFMVNGILIKNHITLKKIIDIIGYPEREFNDRKGYATYNGTLIYDRYGLTIEFFHGKGSYLHIYYNKKQTYCRDLSLIPRNIFQGTLTCNKVEFPTAKAIRSNSRMRNADIKNFENSLTKIGSVKSCYADINEFSSRIGNKRLVSIINYEESIIEGITISIDTKQSQRKKL